MNKRFYAAIAASLLGLAGCLQPIPTPEGEATGAVGAARVVEGVEKGAYPVYTFFDEDFQQGGFTYTYGGASKVRQKEGIGADGSEYFLSYNLDQRDYSGAAVCLWNMSYDMVPYLKTGAVVFQARGKNGGERGFFGLVDDEKSDGAKTVVRVDITKYGTIKQGEWTTFVIPLRDFGKRGVAWDAAKGIEVPLPFQWDNVQEFRVLTNKNDNPAFEIDVDNVIVYADAVSESNEAETVDWLDMDQSTTGPDPELMKLSDVMEDVFIDDLPPGGFQYVYGGKTVAKGLEATNQPNGQVYATYFDNDYSGVNISMGSNRYIDLTPVRKTGTLSFWVKAGPAAQKFMVGIMDNQGGEKKVQTKVTGNDYGNLKEGEWVQVRIPLKMFQDFGTYWDAGQGREIASKIDWTKIQEIRFSINRDENKPGAGNPVIFYFDNIQFTSTSTGVYDPDAYWNEFKSNAPDMQLMNFDGIGANEAWSSQHGNTADISVAIQAGPKGTNGVTKGNAIKIDFKPGDWFDAMAKLEDLKTTPADWSKHYAMSMWIYTDKPYQSFDVTILDRDHEMFLAQAGATRGWTNVLIPFRDFYKFPYYQPPEAKQNNLLDLDGVYQVGFKPGGEVPGTFWVDNMYVTNTREVIREKAPPVLNAIVTGSTDKVIKEIGDIYGVNVGLWAPELIEEEGLALHKPMNLGTVRYPGGLRSDEENWKQTLQKKDFHVDTDEFLDWCGKVGVEPMFTANVGDGSAEMAAEWVEYVNKKRSGPRVKYWEIGNEVYGDWHKYYDKWGKDGGAAYAKQAREHILAMKAVDPDIKITIVWQLTGKWNEVVMKEVADIVDGVNVHHYAQKAGSDNDLALLSVSAEANEVMESVRQQVEKYGKPGKHYDIWLTEWNSVDFNPGAQILQPVNGIFVADYLGHLAQSPIEKANIWALYNGRDKRNGDYGLLSVAADVQGLNAKRPAYWAVRMMANALSGKLLQAKSDQENLATWMSRRADGKIALVFVNKAKETDFKTTLKIPGLKGKATIQTLTPEHSGGLKTDDPHGEHFDQDGPSSESKDVSTGSVLTIPKFSIVTIVMD
ncbi:MAG: hypothetical protein H6686_10410 [Fibrobacteria bacterium]|nr:hypothetical protein [Fibrobacteria bacterium]